MSVFPITDAESLTKKAVTFPLTQPCKLLVGFDKLQHLTLLQWFEDNDGSNDKGDTPVYIMPLLSDRFSLMKDILIEGLEAFFKNHKDHVFPAFVNRVQFFGATGLTENKPVILYVMPDGRFKVIDNIKD